MKKCMKILALLMVLLCVIALAACTQTEQPDQPDEGKKDVLAPEERLVLMEGAVPSYQVIRSDLLDAYVEAGQQFEARYGESLSENFHSYQAKEERCEHQYAPYQHQHGPFGDVLITDLHEGVIVWGVLKDCCRRV